MSSITQKKQFKSEKLFAHWSQEKKGFILSPISLIHFDKKNIKAAQK